MASWGHFTDRIASMGFYIIIHSLLTLDIFVFTVAQSSENNTISELHFGSMKTFMKTNGSVHHLNEDSFIPGNILFAEDHSLKTTDGKAAHHIVGSVRGYAEGISRHAKFYWIAGFLQINCTHVLVVDAHNHCLRFMSRLTNQTSQFVGSCNRSGLTDGYYTEARFRYPWSVIEDVNNLQTVIVCEFGNKAIRAVNLADGKVITLIKSLPDDPFGAAFHSNKEDLFVILRYSLGKFSTKTSTFTTLASSNNKSGLDGDFTTASFNDSAAILHISHGLLLVADTGSNKLKIVDIKKRRIHSVCNGVHASEDGEINNCSLRGPSSLLLMAGNLYIGEDNSIRIIPVREIPPCHDVTAMLSIGEQFKCIDVIPGYNMCYPAGEYYYQVTGRNCSITITANKKLGNITCPPGIYEVADAETLKAKISLSDRQGITLPIGKYIYYETMSDNITCEVDVDVLDPRLKKRLDISASYQLSCALLNDYKAIISSVARMRYSQIRFMSSRYCNQSAEQDIVMSCTNDVLTVLWPTDCVFQSNSVIEQQKLMTDVKKYLRKSEISILELLIPYHIKPIIEPMTNHEGLPATVILTPVCLGGLKYRNTTQTCQ